MLVLTDSFKMSQVGDGTLTVTVLSLEQAREKLVNNVFRNHIRNNNVDDVSELLGITLGLPSKQRFGVQEGDEILLICPQSWGEKSDTTYRLIVWTPSFSDREFELVQFLSFYAFTLIKHAGVYAVKDDTNHNMMGVGKTIEDKHLLLRDLLDWRENQSK